MIKIILRNILPRNRFGDAIYAYVRFLMRHKRIPTNRLLFNDVLFNLKVSDEIVDPLRVFVSDKEFLKIYVRAMTDEKYNVPTINILSSDEEIDKYDFPPSCCIKPTHLSGAVILRTDNEPLDKGKIKRWLKKNHYRRDREANYKTLKPKIIVEPIIFGNSNLEDYKFFCFNGVVKLVQVDIDRRDGHKRLMFDRDWNVQDFSLKHPRASKEIARPDNYDEMVSVVERLASNFGFVRVDLYTNGQACLVGEITNCHGGACERFIPKSGELTASEIIFS